MSGQSISVHPYDPNLWPLITLNPDCDLSQNQIGRFYGWATPPYDGEPNITIYNSGCRFGPLGDTGKIGCRGDLITDEKVRCGEMILPQPFTLTKPETSDLAYIIASNFIISVLIAPPEPDKEITCEVDGKEIEATIKHFNLYDHDGKNFTPVLIVHRVRPKPFMPFEVLLDHAIRYRDAATIRLVQALLDPDKIKTHLAKELEHFSSQGD